MSQKPPHILIAVPNMGNVRADLAVLLIQLATQKRYQVTVFILPKPQIPHSSARNIIVRAFLNNPAFTHLLQIDSDVVPPATVLEMVEHNVDIVSGVAFVYTGEEVNPISCSEVFVDGVKKGLQPTFFTPDGPRLVNVDFIGGGCVLVKRKVFETLRQRKIIPYVFEFTDEGILLRGEDYHFAGVARAAGFKVFVDRDTLCRHYKTVELAQLNLTLNQYLRTGQATLSQAQHANGNSDGGANAGEGSPPARGATG